MLDDRKFYFPIVPEDPGPSRRAQPDGRGSGCASGARRRRTTRSRWTRTRPSSVSRARASNRRRDAPWDPPDRLRPGRRERDTPAICRPRRARREVKVALVWGQDAGDRQVVALAAPQADYRTPAHFVTAGADTDAARSKSPAPAPGASTSTPSPSCRPTISTASAPKPPRSSSSSTPASGAPGGNFISDYNWYDALGPRDKRPPTSDSPGTPCRPTTSAWTNCDPAAHRRRALHHRQCRLRRRAFGRRGGRVHERRGQRPHGACARGTDTPSPITSSSGISATSPMAGGSSAAPT